MKFIAKNKVTGEVSLPFTLDDLIAGKIANVWEASRQLTAIEDCDIAIFAGVLDATGKEIYSGYRVESMTKLPKHAPDFEIIPRGKKTKYYRCKKCNFEQVHDSKKGAVAYHLHHIANPQPFRGVVNYEPQGAKLINHDTMHRPRVVMSGSGLMYAH